MVSPPLVILGTIFRPSLVKPFFGRILNGVIKWTVVGAGTGGAVGWYKMKDEAETAILDRVERLVRPPAFSHKDIWFNTAEGKRADSH